LGLKIYGLVVGSRTSHKRKEDRHFMKHWVTFVTSHSVTVKLYRTGFESGGAQSVSDWVRAGRRPSCRSSTPGRVKNFLFSTASDRPWGPPGLL
jgi:hypothetical protein